MFIKEDHITDTCVSDYNEIDGEILQMTSNVDKTCDEDKSVMAIFDEEDEESCSMQEDNQYDLIICRTI